MARVKKFAREIFGYKRREVRRKFSVVRQTLWCTHLLDRKGVRVVHVLFEVMAVHYSPSLPPSPSSHLPLSSSLPLSIIPSLSLSPILRYLFLPLTLVELVLCSMLKGREYPWKSNWYSIERGVQWLVKFSNQLAEGDRRQDNQRMDGCRYVQVSAIG